jgi:hypothetical protein
MNFLKTISAFLLVLMLMPLGHALMILMEHFLEPTALHYSAFTMGFVGLVVTIIGMFRQGDTRQTIYGITGAMLFWTGWVEFLFAYYAQRYGAHCDLIGSGIVQTTTQYVDGIGVSHDFLINGEPIETFSRQELKVIRGSRPEYLIMPATFGMWVMVMMFYIFRTRTGCDFIRWIQKKLKIKTSTFNLQPSTYNSALTVFMQWNVMMWGSYLLLMFCYDPVFLGSRHPVTLSIGVIALVASFFMMRHQMCIKAWGRSIRYALATVIVFWTFVEVMARNGILNEIWVDPLNHITEMLIIFVTFIVAIFFATRLTTSVA